MKIILAKNVKYKKESYKKGEEIAINKSDLKDFEEAEAIQEIVDDKQKPSNKDDDKDKK